MNFDNQLLSKEKYIPLILRVIVGLLWVWMGIVPKLIYPEPRVAMVSKSWVIDLLPMSPAHFIFILAIAEIITGVMLLLGLFTRLASIAQALMIIMIIVGVWNIAAMHGITSPHAHLVMKDIPLFGINMVLIITGGGLYSIDNWRKQSKGV